MAQELTKQPTETKTWGVDFVQRKPVGTSIVSAVGYISDKRPTLPTTTLTEEAAALATTVVLNNNPGVGALLILDRNGPDEETVKVSAVSGSAGAFTATLLSELMYSHADNAQVHYEPGVPAMLVSQTLTVAADIVVFRVRRGAAGHIYRFSVLATFSNTDIEEGEVDVVVTEL